MKLKTLLVLAGSYHHFRSELVYLEKCADRVVYVKDHESLALTPAGTAYVTLAYWYEKESNRKALEALKQRGILPAPWSGSVDTWPAQAELETKKKKVKKPEPDDSTLHDLLRRVRDVSEYSLPASLRDLRSAWLEAGCHGLERPVQIGSKPDVQLLVSGGKLSDEQVARFKEALIDMKVQKLVPIAGVTIEPDPATLRRMLGEAIDVLVNAGDAVPPSLNDAYELLAADRNKKEGKPS